MTSRDRPLSRVKSPAPIVPKVRCMPSYRYEVKTSNGQVQVGVLNAATMSAASEMLRAQQSYIWPLPPADARKSKASLGSMLNFSMTSGPGLKDVSNFTNQLAVMIKAGI